MQIKSVTYGKPSTTLYDPCGATIKYEQPLRKRCIKCGKMVINEVMCRGLCPICQPDYGRRI